MSSVACWPPPAALSVTLVVNSNRRSAPSAGTGSWRCRRPAHRSPFSVVIFSAPPASEYLAAFGRTIVDQRQSSAWTRTRRWPPRTAPAAARRGSPRRPVRRPTGCRRQVRAEVRVGVGLLRVPEARVPGPAAARTAGTRRSDGRRPSCRRCSCSRRSVGEHVDAARGLRAVVVPLVRARPGRRQVLGRRMRAVGRRRPSPAGSPGWLLNHAPTSSPYHGQSYSVSAAACTPT